MGTEGLTRRGFLTGLGALGAASLLGGCVTSAGSGGGAQTGGAVTIESNLSDPVGKAGMQALVAAFNKRGATQGSLNTIDSETFRTQLPTLLTSANPPDTYTWYAGSVARSYADKGLLLDVSDVWKTMSTYSPALKSLSSTTAGRQIFVPTSYYWWGMFYRKSNFAKWGVRQVPTNWSEFVSLCEQIKGKGVAPIGLGAGGDTPWVASGWFDYLDIRLNGATYHRDLLAGKHSFADPQVHKVFQQWSTVLPYFDPQSTAIPFQDATTSLLQGRTGMMLIGTFFADAVPKDTLDDIDFFQFPIIDPSVPVVEEGPTDGFFASSHSSHLAGTRDFLTYMATAPAQELYIKTAGGTVLPTNPAAKDAGTALVAKGKAMLAKAADLTQFFNRDSSDALQPTADAALTQFIDQPGQVGSILNTWQAAATKVWSS
ncbi:MAG TPA: substrate-binding domain-containing protein [Pseudonocardiaceae bacterium]|jgi:multiple sugar transport system substrate-binding protein|nr:substrate-binding domain-containing protein [Pseudonocardiaceae bacterium]